MLKVVLSHGDRLTNHEQRLQLLERPEATGSAARRGQAVAPWIWAELDADSLRHAWGEVAAWLATQASAHAVVDRVPRDWYRYHGLVAHITALMHWQYKANQVDSHPRDVVDWEEAFYRMVDYVWPRYTTKRRAPASTARADRAMAQQEDLMQYIETMVRERQAQAANRRSEVTDHGAN